MSQVLTSKYPTFNYTLTGFAPYGVIDLPDELKLLELLRRIRLWEIDLNVSEATVGAYPDNGTYLLYNAAGNIDGVDDNVSPSEREFDMGTGRSHGGTIAIQNAPISLFSWHLFDYFAVGTTAGVEDSWQIETSLFVGTGIPGASLDSKNVGGISPVSAAVCTLYGYPVTLYDTSGTWTGSITATPIEWWERRPSSGGAPIFDSATGTQIGPNVLLG